MSVTQGYAQLRVHIPVATRLVKNELQIGSATLGESHSFSLREY